MAKTVIRHGALTINVLSGEDLARAREESRQRRLRSLEAARRDPWLARTWAAVGVTDLEAAIREASQ